MLRISNNYDFVPEDKIGQEILTRKTIVGGAGYYRSFGLEKLFRDVQATKHHPLPEKEQVL